MMIFEKILQVAMVVNSIYETVRVYYDKYKIGPWNVYELNSINVEDMKIDGKRINYKMRTALTNIGGIRVELIEPLDDITIHSKFLKINGEGLHHVAYEVDDFNQTVKYFKDQGMVISQEGKWLGIHHFAYLNSENDLKHIVEIYKTIPDFFKYEFDSLGNKRIIYPKPDYTYP
jgi:methylmalonyl-CoA/ethylmalonyl-CoA epimerase